MKTTLDIQDSLLVQAKRHAKRVGKPLRAIVEDGLRAVLSKSGELPRFELPDRAVGCAGDPNPLSALTSDELRELMHGGR
jgi:hypothetical protein